MTTPAPEIDWTKVRSTPWADTTRRNYTELAEFLPLAMETEFDLWQKRVDLKGHNTPYQDHTFLFCITATRYEKAADGVTRMVEPEESYSFVVAAHTRQDAIELIKKELSGHKLNPLTWMFTTRFSSVLILHSEL